MGRNSQRLGIHSDGKAIPGAKGSEQLTVLGAEVHDLDQMTDQLIARGLLLWWTVCRRKHDQVSQIALSQAYWEEKQRITLIAGSVNGLDGGSIVRPEEIERRSFYPRFVRLRRLSE